MSAPVLPPIVRIISQNTDSVPAGHSEPAVENVKETLHTFTDMFDGALHRTFVTQHLFPAQNDGPHKVDEVNNVGVQLEGGSRIYFMDLAPGCLSPMHRTTTKDTLVCIKGTATLITPKHAFDIADNIGNYTETEETAVKEGECVVQRGQFHAWKNGTNEWVRMMAVVEHADTQKMEVGADKKTKDLGEVWLSN